MRVLSVPTSSAVTRLLDPQGYWLLRTQILTGAGILTAGAAGVALSPSWHRFRCSALAPEQALVQHFCTDGRQDADAHSRWRTASCHTAEFHRLSGTDLPRDTYIHSVGTMT